MEEKDIALPNNYNNIVKKIDENSNINDFQEIIKKIKLIDKTEHKTALYNYAEFFPSIKNDSKTHLLLIRTFYLKEFVKIERFINNKEFLNKNYKLINEEYKRLINSFNILLNLQKIYINNEDYAKSLQLQNKIINILKNDIVYKIG